MLSLFQHAVGALGQLRVQVLCPPAQPAQAGRPGRAALPVIEASSIGPLTSSARRSAPPGPAGAGPAVRAVPGGDAAVAGAQRTGHVTQLTGIKRPPCPPATGPAAKVADAAEAHPLPASCSDRASLPRPAGRGIVDAASGQHFPGQGGPRSVWQRCTRWPHRRSHPDGTVLSQRFDGHGESFVTSDGPRARTFRAAGAQRPHHERQNRLPIVCRSPDPKPQKASDLTQECHFSPHAQEGRAPKSAISAEIVAGTVLAT